MQLNDILEENSIKAISHKTKIPENNLEALFGNKFDRLPKVKTFGFISILEREYGAELQALRSDATRYYEEFIEDQRITLDVPDIIERKGKSKFVYLFVFLLLGYATWYFFTQFDQKHFEGLLKFSDHNETEMPAKDLSIASVAIEEIRIESNSTEQTEQNESVQSNVVVSETEDTE